MRDERKTKEEPATELARLRRKVAELEVALQQAEEDCARATARFSDLQKVELLEQESHLFADSIVQTVLEPLMVLDEELRVRMANRSFYETFQVTLEETSIWISQSVLEGPRVHLYWTPRSRGGPGLRLAAVRTH